MKSKLTLTTIAILLLLLSSAQTPVFEWAKRIGAADFDDATAIAVDASGNSFITGSYRGTVDFDPGSGVFNLNPSGGVAAAYILKLDVNGNFVWAKNFESSFFSSGLSIKLDANGNIYVTGNYNGTVDFDPGIGTSTLTSNKSQSFVLKLNSSGNFVWVKTFTSSVGMAGYSIDIDATGNVYTTGTFEGTTDFDPSTSATFNLVSAGSQDIFVSKLDANGNFVWAKKVGGTGNEGPPSMSIDAAGNSLTTGSFSNTVDFDPGTSTFNITATGQDGYIFKLDAAGNFIWAKHIDGATPNAIVTDATNNIYTTGSFAGVADFNPGAGTYTINAFASDGYILKLDVNGNFGWAKHIAQSGAGKAIAKDVANNIYVAGHFISTANTDAANAGYNFTSIGNYDIFAYKLNPTGSFLWGKRMGGAGIDYGMSITVDGSYNVYTTGTFQGTADFNLGSTSYSLTESGSTPTSDIFIHKMSQCSAPATPSVNASGISACAGNTATLSATSSGTVNWFTTSSGGSAIASGTNYIVPNTLSVGIYSYYAEAITCTNSATRAMITITVNPLPTVTANSGAICTGKSFTILPAGATNYTYSGGSNIVSPTSNSSYTVIGSDVNGCVNNAVSNVTVNPLPTIVASTSSTLVCVGQAVTLTAVGANNYVWSNNVNASVNVVSPGVTTIYTLTGTDANGCSNTSAITQSVSTCTGINDELETNDTAILIYPNPNNGVFIIEATKPETIELVDVLGRRILKQQSEIGKYTIDITDYANGFYFLKTSTRAIRVVKH